MNWQTRNTLTLVALLMAVVCFGQAALAEDNPVPTEDPAITVAVLGFEAPGGEAGQIGTLINDTIEVMLSGSDRFRVVDRSSLTQTLNEQGINLSGVTDTNNALKVGRVVGAKLLVTGKIFELGESRILTAKIIGTETTLVEGVLVKGDLDTPLDKMVFELTEQTAAKIVDRGPKLVASELAEDPIPGMIEQLKQRKLPVFAIVIPEEHRAIQIPTDPPDPAVETELKLLLIQAGADVRDVKDNALADWVNAYTDGGQPAWPRTLEGVNVVIIGEAFSESAGSLGDLRLASARAEINVISRKDGRIIHADRATTRAVDLADEVAGKTALEKAGRVIGERLLTYLIESTGGADDAR